MDEVLAELLGHFAKATYVQEVEEDYAKPRPSLTGAALSGVI
jgi:hypothetical protein